MTKIIIDSNVTQSQIPNQTRPTLDLNFNSDLCYILSMEDSKKGKYMYIYIFVFSCRLCSQ